MIILNYSSRMKYLVLAFTLVFILSQCRSKQQDYNTVFPGKPEVPSAIQKEHDELLTRLEQLALTGDSAKQVREKLLDLMEYHFEEEEAYVLPPLGLLPSLASGEVPDQTEPVVQLTAQLQSKLQVLSAEHQMIAVHMVELKQAVAEEQIQVIEDLEHDLYRHADWEEEILFPTAILVGEILKMKSNAE